MPSEDEGEPAWEVKRVLPTSGHEGRATRIGQGQRLPFGSTVAIMTAPPFEWVCLPGSVSWTCDRGWNT